MSTLSNSRLSSLRDKHKAAEEVSLKAKKAKKIEKVGKLSTKKEKNVKSIKKSKDLEK